MKICVKFTDFFVLSAMNFFIFFVYVPLVHSEPHTLITSYINERTDTGILETSSTNLDGEQIDYFDSEMKLIPTQDWIKECVSEVKWKEYTQTRERVQQANKVNITDLMEIFNQKRDTYQRIYGCDWNDETGVLRGFDEHSYDGNIIFSLDMKSGRYTASVNQAIPIVWKWNQDTELLHFLQKYYQYGCYYWLLKLATFNKRGNVSGQSLTEPIQDNLPTSTKSASDDSASWFYHPVFTILVILGLCSSIILIALCCYKKPWKKDIYYKKHIPSSSSQTNQSDQRLMTASE